jgi:hypothetical protein
MVLIFLVNDAVGPPDGHGSRENFVTDAMNEQDAFYTIRWWHRYIFLAPDQLVENVIFNGSCLVWSRNFNPAE